MNNKHLWMEFSHNFGQAFTDTASKQHAYRELVSCMMVNKTIDEYIAHFKHLLQKAGWDRMSWESLFQFKKGLECWLHLKILQKEPMLVETLDAWEEAAWREVKQQAFIDASLGPREFKIRENTQKDQQRDRQGKWKKGNFYQKIEKDSNAMDPDMTCIQEYPDKWAKEKQLSKGCCFKCNKQGHMKRDCPTKERAHKPQGPLNAKVLSLKENLGLEVVSETDSSRLQEMGDLMTKLRGMLMEDKDEVINTLLWQEDF